MSIKAKLAATIAAVSAASLVPQVAFADFSAPAAQNFTNLLGDSTADAETGVYELAPLIESAGLAIVTLTVIMVGIVFARKVVRKFTG